MQKLVIFIVFIICSNSLRNSATIKGSSLSLGWQFQDDYIDVEIISKNATFVPILLGSKMSNTDLWVCQKQDSYNQWTVKDYWSSGHTKPISDIKMNGSSDLMNTSVIVLGNQLICSFRRKLVTGDSFDIDIKINEYLRVCSQDSSTTSLIKHKSLNDIFCFNWPLKQGIHNQQLQIQRFKPPLDIKLIHGVGLTIAWGLLIDIAIMCVRYLRTLKYYKLAHTIIFIIVNFSSLPLIIIMVVKQKRKIFYGGFSGTTLGKQIHIVFGLTTLFLIVIEHILGMIVIHFQQNRTKPVKYFKILQSTHKIIGYSLYIINKVQIINGWWIYMKSKALVAVIMFILFTLLLVVAYAIESYYRSGKLQKFLDSFEKKRSMNIQLQSSIYEAIVMKESFSQQQNLMNLIRRGISKTQIRKIFPNSKYYFFKDMICQLNNFNHPGGDSLTQQGIGSDITKYIYGVSSLEGNQTHAFAHSHYAVQMIERNVIGAYVPNQITLNDRTSWRITSTQEVSPNVFKFTIDNYYLKMDISPTILQNYVGRYWLVSTAYHTRTYTLLVSQLDQNIRERNMLIQAYQNRFSSSLEKVSKINQTSQIVLIIKKYPKGRVSKQIHQKNMLKKIQGLYGSSLSIKRGLNIIITGGTGILTFLDLFDLLLKKAIVLASKSINPNYSLNGLQSFQCLYRGSKFIVYSSFKQVSQFKYFSWLVTLHQISAKYHLDLFQFHIRQLTYLGIPQYQGRIDQKFLRQILVAQNFAKIFCCGPLQMNQQIYKLLKLLQYPEDMYSIL